VNITLPAHPPSTTPAAPRVAEVLQSRTPRTALPDRIAMRIGLALLLWGTRPIAPQAPDVSGFGASHGAAPRRDIERTVAAYQHPFPPLAR